MTTADYTPIENLAWRPSSCSSTYRELPTEDDLARSKHKARDTGSAVSKFLDFSVIESAILRLLDPRARSPVVSATSPFSPLSSQFRADLPPSGICYPDIPGGPKNCYDPDSDPRPGPDLDPAVCRGDFLRRLHNYFGDHNHLGEQWGADIDGACVVNDKHGDYVGGFGRGRAQRKISAKWGWPNAIMEPPWTVDTRVETASVSKMITTMMLMRMVEVGWVSLDDSIGDALPPFMNYDKYLALGNSDVTYRQLLQHRSGWDSDCDFLKNVRRVKPFAEFLKDPSSKIGPEPACSEGKFSAQGAWPNGAFPSGYANANFSILRMLIPFLTFPDKASREAVWQTLEPLSDDDKYDVYSYWTAWSFQKLSWIVQSPAGLGEIVLTRNTATHAAGYGHSWPEGAMTGNSFDTTGPSGMKYSARELGKVLSALRKGKILTDVGLSLMFDGKLGDPKRGRLGWVWQWGENGPWGHGGDGVGVNNLILFGGKGSAVVLTNRIGKCLPEKYNSGTLWKDISEIYSYSCVSDY